MNYIFGLSFIGIAAVIADSLLGDLCHLTSGVLDPFNTFRIMNLNLLFVLLDALRQLMQRDTFKNGR